MASKAGSSRFKQVTDNYDCLWQQWTSPSSGPPLLRSVDMTSDVEEKLPDYQPMHPHRKCLVCPCPQESDKTGGPTGVNPWQLPMAAVLNSGENIPLMRVKEEFGKKASEGLSRRSSTVPGMPNTWLYLHLFFPCLHMWQWVVLFHHFINVSLPKWTVSSLWERAAFFLSFLPAFHNVST